VDRELILGLAGILNSKVENSHGRNIRLQCPLAPSTHARGEDRTPAWSILVDPNAPSPSKCWACNEGGTVEEMLRRGVEMGIDGLEAALSFAEENDRGGLAGQFAKLALRRKVERGQLSEGEPARADQARLERYVGQAARWTHTYLFERGIVAADIRRWQIGYDEGLTKIGYTHIHHRLVFPVWDERGRLVGATMRTVLPEGVDPPKYRDWPGLLKGEVFYGEHRVDTTRRVVYLVEGILDVIVASRYLPNVLGMLGANTGLGTMRLEKLRRWADCIYLCLDPDAAGAMAVEGRDATFTGRDGKERKKHVPGMREILRQSHVVKVVDLPHRQDPAVLRERIVPLVGEARYLM